MIEIKDLGFGVVEIFDKDTQYAPAQSIKIGNTTYIREDLINKQIADLQHRLEVADRAVELACDELRVLNYRTFDKAGIDFEQQFKEQAEAEINKRSNNDE